MKKFPVELGLIDLGFYYTARRYIYAHALRCLMARGQLHRLSVDIDLRYLYIYGTVTSDQWFNRFPDGLSSFETIDDNHDPFWDEYDIYFDFVTCRVSGKKGTKT